MWKMERTSVLLAFLLLVFSSATFGIYLVTDYFMDPKFPKIFGQVCGKTAQDDCLWVNSHLNTFGLANYGANRDCITTLDASDHPGSLYKLSWKRFKIESGDCSNDYLELYDASMDNINSSTNLIGRFCGWSYPNITGYPTQQFLTLKWHTNGAREDKGFRVMATRNLPYPCFEDFYHCKSENRCVDSRLKCDGIEQCDDGEDESSCSGWEKFIGGLLALGTAGLVGVAGAVLFGCILIGVIICAVTCCKRPCGKCWRKICKPCCDGTKRRENKEKSLEEPRAGSVLSVRGNSKETAVGRKTETPPPSVKAIPVLPAPVENGSVRLDTEADDTSTHKTPKPPRPSSRTKTLEAGLQIAGDTADVTKVDS